MRTTTITCAALVNCPIDVVCFLIIKYLLSSMNLCGPNGMDSEQWTLDHSENSCYVHRVLCSSVKVCGQFTRKKN